MKLNFTKLLIAAAVLALFAACAVPGKKADAKAVPPPAARVAHVPAGAAPGSIMISFRLDGITFETYQKPVLENARFMAGKYGIIFDLAVIAAQTGSVIDPAVLGIYSINQDAFEIIANGLTWQNEVNRNDRGEFYDLSTKQPMPYEIQEQHIRDMTANFQQRGLYTATQILIAPSGAGDENTIKIAEKYGYRMIVQNTVPDGTMTQNYDNRIIVQNTSVGVPGRPNISDNDVVNIDKRIQQLIDKNAVRIQVVFGMNNFRTQEASVGADRVLYAVTSIYKNPAIKFVKISSAL